jgi:hypothetical protein
VLLSSVVVSFLIDIEISIISQEIEDTLEARLAAAAKDHTKPRGNPYYRGASYFTDFEFEAFAEGVKEAGAMGFMYTEESLREVLQDGVRADLERRAKTSGIEWADAIAPNGDIPQFGKMFMKK